MSTTTLNPLSVMATAPLATTTPGDGATGSGSGDWFDAMAQAWSKSLNKEADTISTMSDSIGAGQDDPKSITLLTAESLRMGFLSDSSHTALSSAGTALDTMARKG